MRKIKKKLCPLVWDDLPDVEQAKALVRERAQDKQKRDERTKGNAAREKAKALAREVCQKAPEALAKKHAQRRAGLAAREQELLVRQAPERLMLHAAQQRESRRLLFRVRSAVADLKRNA